MRQTRFALLLWFCSVALAVAEENPPLSIAVAANFAVPLKTLLVEFAAQTNIKSRVTVSSSGALYAQIEHGAPYDLFLSADSKRPQALISSGKVSAARVKTYAVGRLALVGEVRQLSDPRWRDPALRIAIAEPEVAPYGRAAKQLLQKQGLWQTLSKRLIRGSNIQQTLQFWQTGNVDVAMIAASQCVSYALTCYSLPADYQPIVQQLAILGGGQNAGAAAQLAEFLQSDAVQQQLLALGYAPLADISATGKH
ncbi:molybdate ABC transporter substrate-binding protein [Alteromonas lipolytica]|uniref:Molybdate ABC transporter substrate-binding protein n=1 Tax=Alteromonas lipolytica TaxID=1856405 RepID=A0A1E8FG36_9ALTE|nr:molybdate ABC transporter substrate-binding protein [Alteromonas lipolytica]OFI34890.1 molybdate ABC transporter substrate-binding protein [Alteromonas lipolytica]GGF54877.1 molybdate ABC transporter substrate-binding protein [Alteromonas lipolytica]